MRVTQQQMEATRERIVAGASKLFRERGVRSTTVAELMADAGLTHGGFYRHFQSKDALIGQALHAAIETFISPLEAEAGGPQRVDALRSFVGMYLSAAHVSHPGLGCPLPALSGELAQGSDEVRAAFSSGVRRVLHSLSQGIEAPDRDARAMRLLAMLVGCIALARAGDAALASGLLAACRMNDITADPTGSEAAKPAKRQRSR